MRINLDLDLFVYGLLLGALGVLAHWLAPEYGPTTLILCVAGGVLAGVWGVLGLRGFRRRGGSIGTLIVVDLVLAVQMTRTWLAVDVGIEALMPVAILLTVLLVCGITILVNFVRASWRER